MRDLIVQGSICCPAHLREMERKTSRTSSADEQAIAKSNQIAMFLDAREGEVRQQLAPF